MSVSAFVFVGTTALVALPGPGPLTALDGRAVSTAAPRAGATVLVIYSTECPIANAFMPALRGLARSFPPSELNLIAVCVDPDLSDDEVRAHAREFALGCPIVRDRTVALARRLGAQVTPEAFVFDDRGRLRYHGRIDDRFRERGKGTGEPTRHDLIDAIRAVLAGEEVARPHVEAVGCPLPLPAHTGTGP